MSEEIPPSSGTHKAKRELAAAVALDGQVLDVETILQAIDEWLAEAQKNEWHSKQNTWEIEPWLELLPFSSRPDAVLEGLTKVKAFYGSGWAKRWERVLSAVAAVPGPNGDELLKALAKEHKDIADDYDWMRASLGRNSPASVLLYVDLYIEGVFGRGPHAADAWHVGRELAKYAEEFPALKSELKKRNETAGAGRASSMFEHLFGEIGDDADLIAMVKKYAESGQSFDGRMAQAIESVAVRHEPVRDGSNSYYVHPASVGPIRKVLFDLLSGSPAEAALAAKCLSAIDRLCDDHGLAANDARHPDVMSGKPWPPEAKLQEDS